MEKKINCWEFMNCGREPEGLMEGIMPACPVPLYLKLDGKNGGKAGGRVCWEVKKELSIKERFSMGCSSIQCRDCSFYKRVNFEEEETLPVSSEIYKPVPEVTS